MQYFWEWAVLPMLKHMGCVSLLEIGVSLGHNTEKILRDLQKSRISVVDPCFDYDLGAKFRTNRQVKIYKGKSLEVLPNLDESFDCILIDGDHNFFTVFNELKLIEKRNLLTDRGIIFLHDIGKPYGRRDLFYDPNSIPTEARVPESKQGVLTGVEKFIEGSNIPWTLLKWNSEHGLGCLIPSKEPIKISKIQFLKLCWKGIRWKNRILRKLGLMAPDIGKWGRIKDDGCSDGATTKNQQKS